MGSMASTIVKVFMLAFLSLSLSFLVLTFLPKNGRIVVIHPHRLIKNLNHPIKDNRSLPFDFIENEFKGEDIGIGLVNIHEGEGGEWEELGETSLVRFERVPEGVQWGELFPTSLNIYEEDNGRSPKCPGIPMPRFEEYGEFDVVVSRIPCGSVGEKQGIRDVFRLQVNLVVANLVVRSGNTNGDGDRRVYVVFIGSCGPMWEIFRCDDLLRHEGEFWIYKPDLRRLKQKVNMPVGSCQLSVPHVNQSKGDFGYDFSKLDNPIDHPREAYVTVLHSSEAYVCGAIVLAQTIIRTNSTRDLVLLADESISKESREGLKAAGWKIKDIERIESPYTEKGAYNKWNYSKLRIWQLIEYDKVIFMDSDFIVLKNIDNFFKHPQLSAVRDIGGINIFNSGIMLIEPSECVFNTLMKKRHTLFSYNGGDQGFLNEAFTWWHRWPTKLNFLKMIEPVNSTQLELPESLYIVHYLGVKPWMCYRDYDCNWDTMDCRQFASDSAHNIWWQVHDAMPKRLHAFCSLSKSTDLRIKEWRRMAQNANLPNGHWKIKVKDPRQHNLLV